MSTVRKENDGPTLASRLKNSLLIDALTAQETQDIFDPHTAFKLAAQDPNGVLFGLIDGSALLIDLSSTDDSVEMWELSDASQLLFSAAFKESVFRGHPGALKVIDMFIDLVRDGEHAILKEMYKFIQEERKKSLMQVH